jgi:hypothetical protein
MPVGEFCRAISRNVVLSTAVTGSGPESLSSSTGDFSDFSGECFRDSFKAFSYYREGTVDIYAYKSFSSGPKLTLERVIFTFSTSIFGGSIGRSNPAFIGGFCQAISITLERIKAYLLYLWRL